MRRKGKGVAVGAATVVLSAPAASASASEYRVRPGDTLSTIAARLGTTTARLAQVNGLADPDRIVAGTTLQTSGSSTSASSGSYLVRSGDTLSSIAARLGTSVSVLARANDLSDPNMIVAGTRLRVGGAATGFAQRAPQPSAPPPADSSSIEASLGNHAVSHGVDPSLVKAVAFLESGWQQDAVSSAGAIGVMQLMPDTADYINGSLGGHGLDPRIADHNVHLGVMYLRHLIQTMGSEERALAAYYTGPGNVGTKLDRTQRWYVGQVMSLRERYR
jgi:N-acetylmuramoyl-L-alanine amidase